ncbi:MAG: response regulator, partial [Desulfobacterales bacterium]|nr:response regulator [Desulfobacterales bacterium]
METILIVDDEKNYPLILSAILEDEGYETLTANSGREALEKLSNSDVDLVLTDMKMPSMDGIELLEKIKAIDSELPVIMMTAYGTVEKAVEAMQKGAYNYILKPFDNDSLVLYVKKAVAIGTSLLLVSATILACVVWRKTFTPHGRLDFTAAATLIAYDL